MSHRLSISRTAFEKFEAVQVNTGVLSLSLLPELGGKLNSLRDLRTGREWLWRNPRLRYQRVPRGASYILEADTGGWDECFPTVAPCDYPSPPWAGAHIQDHGELWSQPAALEVVEGDDEVRLRTRWQGVVLPYTFERTISLAAGSATIRLSYTASSRADAPQQFIWSAHPLLAIEPGMSLLLPPSARFNLGSSIPPNLFAVDSGLRFPLGADAAGRPLGSGAGPVSPVEPRAGHEPSAQGIDLSSLPDAAARIAAKLWSDRLDEGWAALRARDGELRMRWDVALLPQLGFWINLGAWAGDGGAPYYNLGLEPCIGAQDSLAEAVQRNLFATLPPHGSRAWWLEVELSPQHVT
jgi:hypothetical protein